MFSPKKYTVRQYTDDDSFTRLNNIPFWTKELQVAFAFARDYDNGNSTNGVFTPCWNTEKVTPDVISRFKNQKHPFTVKFFVTIGGRDPLYPFLVPSAEEAALWVSNATKSLTEIIQNYHLDGIDIYYEHIASNEFADSVGKLIANLKKNRTINVASIAPSAPLNATYYYPLYRKFGHYIGTVVYQFHTEEKPITTIPGFHGLYKKIANHYPKEKLLAGYSTLSRDWTKLSTPLYFTAVGILLIRGDCPGTSIWTLSDKSVTERLSRL